MNTNKGCTYITLRCFNSFCIRVVHLNVEFLKTINLLTNKTHLILLVVYRSDASFYTLHFFCQDFRLSFLFKREVFGIRVNFQASSHRIWFGFVVVYGCSHIPVVVACPVIVVFAFFLKCSQVNAYSS